MEQVTILEFNVKHNLIQFVRTFTIFMLCECGGLHSYQSGIFFVLFMFLFFVFVFLDFDNTSKLYLIFFEVASNSHCEMHKTCLVFYSK